MADDKIIGINDANGLLNSKDYLASIAKKTDEIMGETYEMETDKLLANKDFQSIFTKAKDINMADVDKAVKEIVGKDITKRELNMILALMDAELHNVEMSDGQVKEKFVWDGIFDLSKLSGLFEVTGDEIAKIITGSHYFRESNKPISTKEINDPAIVEDDVYTIKYEDGTVIYKYDKSGKTLVSAKPLEYLRRLFSSRIEAQPDIKPEKE